MSENRETRMPLADGRPLVGATTLATYTLELIGLPREVDPTQYVALRPRWLREAEENLTDLLPEGYSVRIKEWDA